MNVQNLRLLPQCRERGRELVLEVPAASCDVSHDTIRRLEAGDTTLKEETVLKVRAALEKAGCIFIDENGEGPGVRLRKAKRKAK